MLKDTPILREEAKEEVSRGGIADIGCPQMMVEVNDFIMYHPSSRRQTDRYRYCPRSLSLSLMRNTTVGGADEGDGGGLGGVLSTRPRLLRLIDTLNQNHHVRFHQLQKDRPL